MMKNRILTGVGLALALALFFVLKVYVDNFFFDGLILIMIVFASMESSKIFSKMGYFNSKYFAFLTPIFVVVTNCILFTQNLEFYFIMLIDLGIILLCSLCVFLEGLLSKGSNSERKIREIQSKPKFAFKKAIGSFLVSIYPLVLLVSMMFINHFDEFGIGKVAEFGGYLSFIILIFTFLIPIITDTFAMFTGMLIGGKKLCPKLSPKKTISGAVGGVLFTVLISACLYLILDATPLFSTIFFQANFEMWQLLIIVFFGSMIAQCGDLFESFLKRRANVKDSGNALPGHGGVLDRIDSHIFVSVYMLLATIILVLI